MPKPTWRGGECRILVLNMSTRELRAWQYLKIKEVLGCSDAEIKFIRVDTTTSKELLSACDEWKPEAVLVGLNPEDDPRSYVTLAAEYPIIKFDLNDRLVRAGSDGEIFAPQEAATANAAKDPRRYGDPGPMGLDAIDHGRNDL